jgi:pimeloyl-ACP methyl ester carboxylesterase
VAGNSLGGWVALELAARGRAKAVVGVSPAGFAKPWEAAVGRSVLFAGAYGARRAPGLTEWLLRRPRGRVVAFNGIMAMPARMPPYAAIGAARNLARSPGFDPTMSALKGERFTAGAQVDVPVSLLWGTKDYVLFPWQVRRALRELPQARHVPLYGSGHVPMWDDPATITRELLAV